MRRRDFVKGVTAAGAVAALPFDLAHAVAPAPAPAPAAAIPYGSAVRGDALVDDYAYRMALAEYCQLVVPEGALKWWDLRPSADQFSFYEADKLLEFADANGMKMRGHTLVWYAGMPDWTGSLKTASAAGREFDHHIATVVGRYRGRIPSWDVVNEAIAENPTQSDYLRPNLWLETLGKSYLEKAFRRAAESDGAVQLVINEYDIECVGDYFKKRRDALLRVIRDLRDRDAPVHAVGFQGHIKGGFEIDKEGVSAFVEELKAMDVDVLVTELDVIDNELPGDIKARDAAIAGRATDLLDAIFDVARPTALLSWGISDRYTWVPMYYTRDDGSPNRPLPLDREYRRKPLMDVIQTFAAKPA